MRRHLSSRLAAAALILFSAACTDRQPLLEASAEPGLSSSTQPAEWKGFWKSVTELWVYDMTPEIGMNSAFGGASELQRIRNAGMRLIRHGLPWSLWVEKGHEFTAATSLAGQYGAEYVLVIAGPRDAAMQNTNPETWSDRNAIYQQLANDIETMIYMYPQVKFYQLFNEPDASCEPGKFFNGWSSHGYSHYLYPDRYVQGRNYADMLKVVYPRMKAAAQAVNRPVWLVTAGFTGNETITDRVTDPNTGGTHCVVGDNVSWEFVRGMYENGGRDYFDILAMHAYGPLATSPNSILERTHSLNYQIHALRGDPNRPLWVTEFGTSAANSESLLSPNRDLSQDGAVLDEIQRQWYEDAIAVQVQGQHLQKILGFTYATDEGGTMSIPSGISGASPWDYSLGIFRGDRLTGRPSYNWLLGRAAINAAAENHGTRTGTFRIRTNGQVPVHHPYYWDGQDIVIQNVQVNSLYPTVIPMHWPPSQPGPCDPNLDPFCPA
jgi:hypothetical protein